MIKIKPLADRVVLQKITATETTASGIILPDSAKEKPDIALVVAIGKDVKEIKVQEKVVYSKYAGTEIKINGQEYLIVKEEDILARV